MRGADGVCLAQELVRDKLPRPNSDSERDTAVGDCRGFDQAPDVANFSLRVCCVQVVNVVNDFCFQWFPLSFNSGVGDVEVLKKR